MPKIIYNQILPVAIKSNLVLQFGSEIQNKSKFDDAMSFFGTSLFKNLEAKYGHP